MYIFVVQLTTIKMTRQQFYAKHRERTENFDTDSVLMRIVSTLSDVQHINNFKGENKKQDINDICNALKDYIFDYKDLMRLEENIEEFIK